MRLVVKCLKIVSMFACVMTSVVFSMEPDHYDSVDYKQQVFSKETQHVPSLEELQKQKFLQLQEQKYLSDLEKEVCRSLSSRVVRKLNKQRTMNDQTAKTCGLPRKRSFVELKPEDSSPDHVELHQDISEFSEAVIEQREREYKSIVKDSQRSLCCCSCWSGLCSFLREKLKF